MNDLEKTQGVLDDLSVHYEEENAECPGSSLMDGCCRWLHIGGTTYFMFDKNSGKYVGLYHYDERGFYPRDDQIGNHVGTGSEALDKVVDLFVEMGVPHIVCKRSSPTNDGFIRTIMLPTAFGLFDMDENKVEPTKPDRVIGHVVGVVRMGNA